MELTECSQQIFEDIQYLQSIEWDNRMEYPLNQVDLLFLDFEDDTQ